MSWCYCKYGIVIMMGIFVYIFCFISNIRTLLAHIGVNGKTNYRYIDNRNWKHLAIVENLSVTAKFNGFMSTFTTEDYPQVATQLTVLSKYHNFWKPISLTIFRKLCSYSVPCTLKLQTNFIWSLVRQWCQQRFSLLGTLV